MSSPNGGGSLPTSQFGSRGSSPEPPETATLSHIKRQFISSLVGSSAEKGVEARGLLTPPKSLRAEEKETRPSSSDSLSSRPSGGDMCDVDIPRTSDELVVFSNEQNHSGGSCEGSWNSDGVRPILLCTLVGGVVASCLKQRLGLVCRVAVSGLGVAKLLCALGYAHVDWGCLFRDLLGIWALSGSDGFLHAIGSALFGSLWRGCAFFGGIIGGFAIL
ncbi:unnamed protein product [Trypanosoma congolense IL3000]|uniref:WGS project CAEQ00000000 data, annotated contig 432 n=1 Tax=Trypanosoma congolense (strain IL3000) TaxID=1068625 RepID=F9WFX4_TRYCI|nr:unnamed protein product [Trypanosoma congolense IL3000]